MKNRYISGKILLTILMLVLFFQSNAQDLVILHTNDTHSNIEPATSGRNSAT